MQQLQCQLYAAVIRVAPGTEAEAVVIKGPFRAHREETAADLHTMARVAWALGHIEETVRTYKVMVLRL